MISNVFGAVLGLLVGGALNRQGNPNGFRSYFYISVGLFALTALTCVFTYNPLPTKSHDAPLKEKLDLDWIGYSLEASSIVLFSLGLFWSQNPYPVSTHFSGSTHSPPRAQSQEDMLILREVVRSPCVCNLRNRCRTRYRSGSLRSVCEERWHVPPRAFQEP